MITLLVGHRGTGKSALMRRLEVYYADTKTLFVDLDQEIKRKMGRSIRELFLEHGEEYFRDLERQIFREIIQRKDERIYICLGAGFDLSVIPEGLEVLWVRRQTDQDGRIFLNRPRLNPEVSPLEEFKARAEIREIRFKEKATAIYTMPEGVFEFKHQAQVIEKSILTGEGPSIGGVLTLLPWHLKNEIAWDYCRKHFSKKEILFELRNDLLSDAQILKVLADLPQEKFIYSFRQNFNVTKAPVCDFYDWPLEQAGPESFLQHIPLEKRIFSLHDFHQGESLPEASLRLEKYSAQAKYLKFSPRIENYPNLLWAFEWQQKNPQQRNIVPRSAQGRWSWFRSLMKNRQPINFWREDEGSSLDQPTLFQWLSLPTNINSFAAVLGDPVFHSFTPMEHQDYFLKKIAPVFAATILRDEWSEALPVLQKLGLRWAAVTAPHKESAAASVKNTTLKALNTLAWSQNSWQGTSTDEEGFLELIEGIGTLAPLQHQIAVWGGGGTLEMLRHALPKAIYFESRTGLPREGEMPQESPQVLIWAAPRGPQTLMPSPEWKPAMVIDLNYKEDSMGREYAQICGANYQSGLEMFLAQARGQRSFWNKIGDPS